MMYELPTEVTLQGQKWAIRSDYRAILDICSLLTDGNVKAEEKAIGVLVIFYPDADDMPSELYEDALKECFKFINLGDDPKKKEKAPKLMDWEQDFQYIVAPVNRVIGKEIRSIEYLHWFTFISAYYEIGDCTFAQIVRIRELLAKGKKMSDFDRDWYREHRDMVDIKVSFTDEENNLLAAWGAK